MITPFSNEELEFASGVSDNDIYSTSPNVITNSALEDEEDEEDEDDDLDLDDDELDEAGAVEIEEIPDDAVVEDVDLDDDLDLDEDEDEDEDDDIV